jgi:hypothetical protein
VLQEQQVLVIRWPYDWQQHISALGCMQSTHSLYSWCCCLCFWCCYIVVPKPTSILLLLLQFACSSGGMFFCEGTCTAGTYNDGLHQCCQQCGDGLISGPQATNCTQPQLKSEYSNFRFVFLLWLTVLCTGVTL